jgi:hypothetical protein
MGNVLSVPVERIIERDDLDELSWVDLTLHVAHYVTLANALATPETRTERCAALISFIQERRWCEASVSCLRELVTAFPNLPTMDNEVQVRLDLQFLTVLADAKTHTHFYSHAKRVREARTAEEKKSFDQKKSTAHQRANRVLIGAQMRSQASAEQRLPLHMMLDTPLLRETIIRFLYGTVGAEALVPVPAAEVDAAIEAAPAAAAAAGHGPRTFYTSRNEARSAAAVASANLKLAATNLAADALGLCIAIADASIQCGRVLVQSLFVGPDGEAHHCGLVFGLLAVVACAMFPTSWLAYERTMRRRRDLWRLGLLQVNKIHGIGSNAAIAPLRPNMAGLAMTFQQIGECLPLILTGQHRLEGFDAHLGIMMKRPTSVQSGTWCRWLAT